MAREQRIGNNCPYCAVTMKVSVMECPVCKIEIKGAFRQSLFQMLDSDEQDLLEQYLLSDFNIKKMEQETGMGYAAIRTRLDKLIAHYQKLRSAENTKKRILDMVAQGRLTAAEAADRIAKL